MVSGRKMLLQSSRNLSKLTFSSSAFETRCGHIAGFDLAALERLEQAGLLDAAADLFGWIRAGCRERVVAALPLEGDEDLAQVEDDGSNQLPVYQPLTLARPAHRVSPSRKPKSPRSAGTTRSRSYRCSELPCAGCYKSQIPYCIGLAASLSSGTIPATCCSVLR